MNHDRLKSSMIGFIIGDALGVPVEFIPRERLLLKPVKDMFGYGTHNQPEGTWSDDTSMMLCTIESLNNFVKNHSDKISSKDEFIKILASSFLNWFDNAHLTPHGKVFDFGNSTANAMYELRKGVDPYNSGDNKINSNGNGSLMRILPFVFCMRDIDKNKRFEYINKISSITHSHILSVMCCFYYVEFGILLLETKDKYKAYDSLKENLKMFFKSLSIDENEINKLSKLLNNDIYKLSEEDIFGDGYVLHSLEAAVWCLMTTDNFKDSLLKAVNLGLDTDTVGALTGGLAGLIYNLDELPSEWVEKLALKTKIFNLLDEYELTLKNSNYIDLF